jgi:tetratricopeptide (TPR) repeat protein
MEKLEGRPLAVAIAQGLAPGHAIAIAIDVASALSYAHAQGIVHRDLKPANIFLQAQTDGTEATRVLDFGLAKFVGRSLPTGPADRSGRDEPTSAHASTLLGTPAYMSPEQCKGDPVDARADVYTLGLVLFESLTAREPYEGSVVELLHHQIGTPLPSVAALVPDAPWAGAVDVLLAKATAKDREHRYANGTELREALVALADTLPPGLVPSVRRSDGGTDGPASGKRSGPIATAPTVAAASARVEHTPTRSPLLAVGAIVALAALAGLGWLVLAPTGDASSATSAVPDAALVIDASTAPDASVEIPDAGVDAFEIVDAASDEVTSDAPDPAAIDPWSRGIPPQLRRYVERTTSRALARRERTAIARWIRTHAEDCRGPLAYGHALMSQGARTEALEHYREALALEPIARNDPRLRTNLLRIAAYDGNPREGAELAAETYGETLLPDIDAFLSTLDPADPDGRRAAQRLRALRTRVAR